MKSLRALTLITVTSAVLAAPTMGQQRPLDHEDVLHWNAIGAQALSPDGGWLVYVLSAM